LLLSLGPLTAAFAQDTARADREVGAFRKLDTALTLLRQRNARDYAIATPNAIDESKYVTIGGIEQWITIRGEDRSNPVLLFLHGGPGDATNPWGFAAFRSWRKHFTVVQWDQRGSGRTLGRNRPSLGSTITIARMTQDGIELTELLQKTLNQDKILLVGHSWGSILGLHMVKARPSAFHAFVGTGQAADPATSYSVAYDEVLREARRRGDEVALGELTQIGPPPWRDGRGFGVKRKWANLFEQADVFLASTLGLALMAPGSSLRDINDWFDGQVLSAEHLVPQTSALSAAALGGTFAVPIFVIQGTGDFTTPASLARKFVDSIRAPRKAYVPIDDGGHFAVFMKSDVFLNELVTRVLPVVRQR
jgi:pimeloyl-ACP methyl ester carboxylesterase